MNRDEEQQLTGNDMVDLVRHAGDGHIEDDNEGAEKVTGLNQSGDWRLFETALV
jgi:hypothetical protein